MAEIPATRYVKSDDVYIAYQVLGEGPFDLLFVPGFVSNVEATWRWPELSAFFRRLASFCRLILFDKRGTGMSDRGSQNFTLEQRMHDDARGTGVPQDNVLAHMWFNLAAARFTSPVSRGRAVGNRNAVTGPQWSFEFDWRAHGRSIGTQEVWISGV
jgi:pimeloyl-ACP methyl ester carboxylesterase